MTGRIALVAAMVLLGAASAGRQNADTAALQKAIAQLSDFNHTIRTEAARVLRRAPAEQVAPLLATAARSHADEYVRYRALTLLSGFGSRITADTMAAVRADRNDRLRMVAYAWYEHNPDPAALPALIEAFAKESSEFVRPALTRALAAQSKDAPAREALAPHVLKGADFFRGAVIEALGEYGGVFAIRDIAAVAGLEGPLQDDAVTALGRLGDKSQISPLVKLQKSAAESLQPTIAAALCLLGHACSQTERYLQETLEFATGTSNYQPLLRGVVHAHALLALRGNRKSLDQLLDAGVAAKAEAVRAPVALGLGTIALRQPELVLDALESRPNPDAAIEVIAGAFDMLAEDFEEERFFVFVRRAFWAAPEGSARRRVAESLINRLEF